MAARDIMPFLSSDGGHCMVQAGPIAAGQSYLVGEPLAWSGGQLQEAADEPLLAATLAGIAAVDGVDENGTARAANTIVQYYVPTPDTLFVTTRYSTDASGTAVAITGAIRGTTGGLLLNNNVWWVDTHVNTNIILIIEDVLNAQGQKVFGATAGNRIVFRFLQSRTAGAA